MYVSGSMVGELLSDQIYDQERICGGWNQEGSRKYKNSGK